MSESENKLEININLDALAANLFLELQQLLDVSMLLQAGVEEVSEEKVSAFGHFISMRTAPGASLSFSETKRNANDWLLVGFLRDSIEIVGLFVDTCLNLCAALELGGKGIVDGKEINRVFADLPKKHHRLPLNQKLEKLKQQHAVDSEFSPQVLSINRARTCVVHRRGVVSTLDVGDSDEMAIQWRGTQIVAINSISGEETLIDRPGILVEGPSSLTVRFVDYEKSFRLGEQLLLSSYEMYCCVITFFQFATSLSESIDKYRQSLGLPLTQPKSSEYQT